MSEFIEGIKSILDMSSFKLNQYELGQFVGAAISVLILFFFVSILAFLL